MCLVVAHFVFTQHVIVVARKFLIAVLAGWLNYCRAREHFDGFAAFDVHEHIWVIAEKTKQSKRCATLLRLMSFKCKAFPGEQKLSILVARERKIKTEKNEKLCNWDDEEDSPRTKNMQ